LARALVGVAEPIIMSQRPRQWPPVITPQSGVWKRTATPRRRATSRATSMSKPIS
jgi:hypothetical protein